MSDDTRDATPEEAAIIEELARIGATAMLRYWDHQPTGRTKPFNFTMVMLSAQLHALGRLMASAPQGDITPDQWRAWLEQNCAVLRATAYSARQQLLANPPLEDGEALRPPILVPQPKFVM
jgi:hypothetical protein